MAKDRIQDEVPVVELDVIESYGAMSRIATSSNDNELLNRTGKKSILKVCDS